MSSFFNRHSTEMFDAKKRFGSGTGGVNTDRALNSDEGESVPESWVELAPSRASLCSSVEAVMVENEGSGEASANKDSRLSPVSLQSPHGVEFETSLDQVKYRLVKDIKNTDWIWDWSSRPEKQEYIPPNKMNRNRSGQIGSTLTTPPNSPEPELSSEFEFKTTKIQKPASSVFWRFEVIVGLVVSNMLTLVLGATIGFCLCKKMSKSSDTVKLNYYYW